LMSGLADYVGEHPDIFNMIEFYQMLQQMVNVFESGRTLRTTRQRVSLSPDTKDIYGDLTQTIADVDSKTDHSSKVVPPSKRKTGAFVRNNRSRQRNIRRFKRERIGSLLTE